jgi:hypothetical protein
MQMIFGWPAILLSLGFAIAGISIRKPALLVTGAILILLPAWYLSHYTIVFASLPLFLLACAHSIARNKSIRAILLFTPVLLSIGVLAVIVLTQ